MPYLIDTHAHVNLNAFKEDGNEITEKTLAKDIWIINVGAQYTTGKRALAYAEKYSEGVYAAVGLHPMHIMGGVEVDPFLSGEREFEEFDRKKYRELLSHPKAVAMGEIGLDYYDKNISQKSKDKQKQVLEDQIKLAVETNKPIIFHCRKAYDDLMEILKDYPKVGGVLHSYMGKASQAEEFLEINPNLYFAFNGIITYARDFDKVINKLPLEKILVETDCPYLTPEPFRGQRNEPVYVEYVAKKLSEIKGLEVSKVANQTTQNAKDLFGV